MCVGSFQCSLWSVSWVECGGLRKFGAFPLCRRPQTFISVQAQQNATDFGCHKLKLKLFPTSQPEKRVPQRPTRWVPASARGAAVPSSVTFTRPAPNKKAAGSVGGTAPKKENMVLGHAVSMFNIECIHIYIYIYRLANQNTFAWPR